MNIKASQILPQFFAEHLKRCKGKERHKLQTVANFKMPLISKCCERAVLFLFLSYFFWNIPKKVYCIAHMYHYQSPYGHCWLQDAAAISEEAATTKLRATQLNDDARQLSNDVDGVTIDLERYEQQVGEDARLVQEVGGPPHLVM